MGVMLGIRNMLNIIFVDWISQYTRNDRAIRKGCLNEKGVQFIPRIKGKCDTLLVRNNSSISR